MPLLGQRVFDTEHLADGLPVHGFPDHSLHPILAIAKVNWLIQWRGSLKKG